MINLNVSWGLPEVEKANLLHEYIHKPKMQQCYCIAFVVKVKSFFVKLVSGSIEGRCRFILTTKNAERLSRLSY